jgi:hypothetical protein
MKFSLNNSRVDIKEFFVKAILTSIDKGVSNANYGHVQVLI